MPGDSSPPILVLDNDCEIHSCRSMLDVTRPLVIRVKFLNVASEALSICLPSNGRVTTKVDWYILCDLDGSLITGRRALAIGTRGEHAPRDVFRECHLNKTPSASQLTPLLISTKRKALEAIGKQTEYIMVLTSTSIASALKTMQAYETTSHIDSTSSSYIPSWQQPARHLPSSASALN
nr:hypothetical protein Iba_chr08cCG4060 [Ipomoea batatas]